MLEILTLMCYHQEDVLKQVTVQMCHGLFHNRRTQYNLYLQSEVSVCMCNCCSV